MTAFDTWKKSYELEIDSTPDKIWRAFIFVPNLSQCYSGVKLINLKSEFQLGGRFSMPPNDFKIHSQKREIVEQKQFIYKACVNSTRVKVELRIEPLKSGLSKVVYTVSAEGPDARSWGERLRSDAIHIMEGLAKYFAHK